MEKDYAVVVSFYIPSERRDKFQKVKGKFNRDAQIMGFDRISYHQAVAMYAQVYRTGNLSELIKEFSERVLGEMASHMLDHMSLDYSICIWNITDDRPVGGYTYDIRNKSGQAVEINNNGLKSFGVI